MKNIKNLFTAVGKLARIQNSANKAVAMFTKADRELTKAIVKLNNESDTTLGKIMDLREHRTNLITHINKNTKIRSKIQSILND